MKQSDVHSTLFGLFCQLFVNYGKQRSAGKHTDNQQKNIVLNIDIYCRYGKAVILDSKIDGNHIRKLIYITVSEQQPSEI